MHSIFIADFFQDEVTYKGYTKHIEAMVAPAPLTMREEELKEIRQTETHVDISTNTRYTK